MYRGRDSWIAIYHELIWNSSHIHPAPMGDNVSYGLNDIFAKIKRLHRNKRLQIPSKVMLQGFWSYIHRCLHFLLQFWDLYWLSHNLPRLCQKNFNCLLSIARRQYMISENAPSWDWSDSNSPFLICIVNKNISLRKSLFDDINYHLHSHLISRLWEELL